MMLHIQTFNDLGRRTTTTNQLGRSLANPHAIARSVGARWAAGSSSRVCVEKPCKLEPLPDGRTKQVERLLSHEHALAGVANGARETFERGRQWTGM